ncbi:MAG TPA: M1 family peptidase, partial [Vicinamibacteria bacterium]|nr:M1 family peptidase [Vicinamibacteria bacterium]
MFIAVALLASLGALPATASPPAPRPTAPAARSEATTQLPRGVRPTHYDVAVTPDAGALTFKGKVAIAIDVLAPTSTLVLNAIDLTFADVRLSGGPGQAAFAPPQVAVSDADQTATFTFAKVIPPGAYRLTADYAGRIGTQAVGLFALDYETPEGRKRALFTQFENSDARRLLPCWDEPSYKATFTLEVEVPSAQMAVSNMPVVSRTDLGHGQSRVLFAPSPKMSTYLLFLAVGDLDRATTHVGTTEIGVVTQKGAAAQAAFALSSSAAVLREYNDYFAVPYPLPKLDN